MEVKIESIEFPEGASLLDVLKAVFGVTFKHEDNSCKCGEECSDFSPTMLYFIQEIARKRGITTDEANEWLAEIEEVYPIAAFNIILREIALYLDSKYEGHISKEDTLYTISSLNGTIIKITNNNIKSYKNFSAFRTIEDARFACHIMKDKIRAMFKDAKKAK